MPKTKDTRTSTGSRSEEASSNILGNEPEEIDDSVLCDFEPCTCEEAHVVRGAERFCSEECADASAEMDEDDVAGEGAGEETCICGHAECEASVSAGAGEERGTGRQPSRTPPGRG